MKWDSKDWHPQISSPKSTSTHREAPASNEIQCGIPLCFYLLRYSLFCFPLSRQISRLTFKIYGHSFLLNESFINKINSQKPYHSTFLSFLLLSTSTCLQQILTRPLEVTFWTGLKYKLYLVYKVFYCKWSLLTNLSPYTSLQTLNIIHY